MTALVLALALSSFAPVGREQLLEAMRASQGYDPGATTNSGRFTIEVLLSLAEKAERDHLDKPLFVGHDDWFQAFLEARGLTPEQAPLYVRLAHEHAQDIAVEYRMDRLIERVVKGPAPRRALAVTVAWPPKPGVAQEFSFEDLLSKPMLQVTNHQQIRYRVLVFDDRIVVDQIEGLTGRPLNGALGLLFKVIGEGRIVEYRMAVSADGTQVSFGRARKALFEVSSTLTVRPDGKAEKNVPEDRPDLREIVAHLAAPIEVRYRPLDLALSEAR